MKAAQRLSQQLGAHINESMGAARPGVPGAPGTFPSSGPVPGGPDKYRGAARIKDALAIELERIVPDPDQPRKDFDPEALADLAASLKARGQLQPIRVRWDDALGRWVIIAGERRYHAARRAGLPTLMCVEAKGPLTPDEILEDQLVENALRADLNPIEQARAFRTLLDRRGYSYRQLAESLHVSHQAVVRALPLLDLPEDLQGRVIAGELSPSVAGELAKIPDERVQREAAQRILAGGLTRDQAVEAIRRDVGRPARSSPGRGRGASPARARKVTTRAFKAAGCQVTVANKRGLDVATVRAALTEALGQLDAAEGRAGVAA